MKYKHFKQALLFKVGSELEVAKYFAQGYVAREIAQILGKSRNTVSAQLRKMTKRLGLESTRDIIKVVHQLNL